MYFYHFNYIHMLVKIIYLLFFAVTDFVIYSILNKTGQVTKKQTLFFGLIFLIVIILHLGLFDSSILTPRKNFLALSIGSFVPFLVYLWFKYLVTPRLDRMNGSNAGFLSSGKKVISFFFLNLIYVIVFIAQCTFIFQSLEPIK
jgi:hypothetical protein